MNDSPISNSNSKKRLDDLRSQLEHLEQKKRLLTRKLNFEKLATLMLSPTVTIVPDKDPRTGELMDINQIKTKLAPCLEAVTEKTYLQGLISAYRFAGVTTFPYKNNRCVRVDTFYNRRFYEPYFIILAAQGTSVDIINHNLPDFIRIEYMDERILPYDVLLFNRVISELLVAYVSRREQFNEFKNHVDGDLVKIEADMTSFTKINIIVAVPSQPRHTLVLTYDNWASIYPTKIDIEKSNVELLYWDKPSYWTDVATAYERNTLLEAYIISRY